MGFDMVCIFAQEVWCIVDVSSVSPSSYQLQKSSWLTKLTNFTFSIFKVISFSITPFYLFECSNLLIHYLLNLGFALYKKKVLI